MKKWILVAMVATLGLTACGVKGPLYFPAEDAQQQSEQTK